MIHKQQIASDKLTCLRQSFYRLLINDDANFDFLLQFLQVQNSLDRFIEGTLTLHNIVMTYRIV